MDLYKKRNEYKRALDTVAKCDIEIEKANQKIKDLEKYKSEKKIEAESIKSDLTVILGSFDSSAQPWLTIIVYYDVDLGRLGQKYTATWKTEEDEQNHDKIDDYVDLREFFSHCSNGFRFHYLYHDIGAFNQQKAIIEFLIEDMFSKKEYQSWNEVKEDLLKIAELYDAPRMNEDFTAYKKRILAKNENNKVD